MPITNIIWDPLSDSYLMETDESGATTAVYTQEPLQYGRLISQKRETETSCFHQDNLGSTRSLTDNSGMVTDNFIYDAWGAEIIRMGMTETPFRWVGAIGYYFENALSNYYIRARLYAGLQGRWLSVDPIIDEMYRNLSQLDFDTAGHSEHTLYAYSSGNPLRRIDPQGALGIDVNPVQQKLYDLTCGDVALISWNFVLSQVFNNKDGTTTTKNKTSSCSGYFVQQVDVTCKINDCSGAVLANEMFTYYEAFFVPKGTYQTTDKKSGSNSADTAGFTTSDNTYGQYVQRGNLAFYCDNSATEKRTGKSLEGWKRDQVHNAGTLCKTTSGSLLSSDRPPKNYHKLKLLATSSRSFSVRWKCCGCQDSCVTASAFPQRLKDT